MTARHYAEISLHYDTIDNPARLQMMDVEDNPAQDQHISASMGDVHMEALDPVAKMMIGSISNRPRRLRQSMRTVVWRQRRVHRWRL